MRNVNIFLTFDFFFYKQKEWFCYNHISFAEYMGYFLEEN
jgi:hypothetical protein